MADDGMEHTNFVEFYPESYRENTVEVDPAYGPRCFLSIDRVRLERFVYRPLNGPDLLMHQSGGTILESATKWCRLPSSRLDLYNLIMEWEAARSYEGFLEDRNLNPDWTWENVAERISRYAESKGFCLNGRQPENFVISVAEAFGKLSIMSEAAGWKNEGPAPPTDVRECPQCHQVMTYEDSIAVQCGHVFHKDCFFPPVWTNFETSHKCFVCQSDLHLG